MKRLGRGKARKSDERRDNIRRWIGIYSQPSQSGMSIDDIAKRTDLPVEQVKESVGKLIAAGLIKPSQIRNR